MEKKLSVQDYSLIALVLTLVVFMLAGFMF